MKKLSQGLVITGLLLALGYTIKLCWIWLVFGIDAPIEDFFNSAFLIDLSGSLRNLFDLILTGDFNGPLFGLMEDSKILNPIYWLYYGF